MKELTKYMPLKEGERIFSTLEGDSYNTSADILSRMVGSIIRIISIIIGSRKKALIVCTDSRLIIIETQKFLFFIDNSVTSKSYTPRSIQIVGYSLIRSLVAFKSHYLELAAGGQTSLTKSKGGKELVDKMITAITYLTETK
ncbi:MAG: hypothetical protein HN548_12030 [Opitutae bacterium]|jgi:hypothetical protein|nr:hypothetical protein [Opitutae bacterium]MBT5717409.1 hypothetical protein [Opitutae bacterium]